MAACSYRDPVILQNSLPEFLRCPPRRRVTLRRRSCREKLPTKVRAAAEDEGVDGHQSPRRAIVDENMALLRQRIRGIRAMDRVDGPLSEWTGLERGYCHTFFESESCEVLGLLQLDLMNKWPRLEIGVTMMVSVTVPVSVLVVVLHLMDAVKVILGRMQSVDEHMSNH